jgi:16S rRNA (guanine966-N2)-methyltransferase
MSQAGRVRIIGGQWRSRIIQFPDSEQLRPTPDRVRETVFNWLGQDLTGKTCLDLFAGSGALGFEAASRGAQRVVMVEQDKKVMRSLQTSIERLHASQIRLENRNASMFLASDTERHDIIFLDPPFKSGLLFEILPLLPPRLTENGVVYVESNDKFLPHDPWSIWKQGRASKVYYCLLNLSRDG